MFVLLLCRIATGRGRASETEAEMGVEFSKNTTAEEIPSTETVAQTLTEGLSNPNITINTNLTVRTDSIQVIRKKAFFQDIISYPFMTMLP